MKQTLFHLHHGYQLPLLVDLIADLQWPQANEFAICLQESEFVKYLLCMWGVCNDDLHDAQDKQIVEANRSQNLINSAITVCAKIFLSTKDLPIRYANGSPIPCKLGCHHIRPY